MTQPEQLNQDLQFVRHAVTERDKERRRTPPGIFIIWGIYVLIGYTLLDFNRAAGGWFLMVGGIVGGIASSFIGRADSRRYGMVDRAEGVKHMLHWGSIFIAIASVIGLSVARGLQGEVVGQFIVLVIGLVYFLGGVHFDRYFIWLGLFLMAGSIGVGFVPRYPWSALGLVLSAGLLIPALLPRRPAASPE
ncbi:MAG: hypothetical protein ACREJC_05485 [Tepidisphaeraceae bacterium]